MIDSSKTMPVFAINYHTAAGQTPYSYVRTRDCPPCACPPELVTQSGGGSLLEIIPCPEESLMCAAFRQGLKVTSAKCDLIISAAAIPVEGRLTKMRKTEKCWLIIKHLFPHASESEQQEMVNKMCGQGLLPDILQSEVSKDVVEAVCTIDQDNHPYFAKILKVALQMNSKPKAPAAEPDALAHRKPKAASDRPSGSGGPVPVPDDEDLLGDDSVLPVPAPDIEPEEIIAMEGSTKKWRASTPPEFRELLPGRHTLPYVYLQCYPNLYIGIYQSSLDIFSFYSSPMAPRSWALSLSHWPCNRGDAQCTKSTRQAWLELN